jgi:uncharacterized protein (DUF433 family)
MIRKKLDSHIETTAGICNGQPRVAGHRITVRQIVTWHDRMSMSADEIASRYELSIADVYAALAYYFDHREEVDAAASADTTFTEELRRSIPSKLIHRVLDDDPNG